ncbi:MAG: DUF397 domain-containing protein [Pseudonocardiales bacterium]|nr:MAG: DUF397 domain-containing protein [Pseudonocardiales bacterium]
MDLSHAVWRKSTVSNGNSACVEVAKLAGMVAVRDSKEPDQAVLVFTPSEWDAFLSGAKAGEFDQAP